MTMIETIKKDIVRIAKKAYREKLVAGTSGNVSVYEPKLGIMFITPSNMDYDIMESDDIVLTNLEGEVLEGKHKPSSEWNLHATIYKNRPDVLSVIHTHSPRATSFAVLKETIPVVLVEMMPFLRGDIQMARFAYPGTKEVGLNAVEKLVNRNACLLENHGVVAIGGTVEQAYIRSVYVEDAAKIYHYARQIGEPTSLDDDILATMKKKYNIEND